MLQAVKKFFSFNSSKSSPTSQTGLNKLITPVKVESFKDLIAEVIDTEDCPRYPPFATGIPLATTAQILQSQYDILERIRSTLKIGHSGFDDLVMPIIIKYAEYIHLLPASKDNHHRGAGGLFRHSLEVALYSAQLAGGVAFGTPGDPIDRRKGVPRWELAAFFSGLFHDAGKPLVDIVVTDREGKNTWDSESEPLIAWAESEKIDRYYIHWRTDRVHKRHEEHSIKLAHALFYENKRVIEFFNELKTTRIYSQMTATINALSTDSKLSALVMEADKISTLRDLKASPAINDSAGLGVPVDRYIFSAMRQLINKSKWLVNKPGAKVWATDKGLFVTWKQSVPDIIRVTEKEKIPGIPRDADTLAQMLIDRGLAIPNVTIRDGQEFSYLYWMVNQDLELKGGKKTNLTLECLKLASLESLFSGEPPAAITVTIKKDNEKKVTTKDEKVEAPEPTPTEQTTAAPAPAAPAVTESSEQSTNEKLTAVVEDAVVEENVDLETGEITFQIPDNTNSESEKETLEQESEFDDGLSFLFGDDNQEETLVAGDATEDIPVAGSIPKATPVAGSIPKETPVAVDAPEETPVAVDAPEETPVAVDAPEEPPVAVDAPEEPPVAVDTPEAVLAPIESVKTGKGPKSAIPSCNSSKNAIPQSDKKKPSVFSIPSANNEKIPSVQTEKRGFKLPSAKGEKSVELSNAEAQSAKGSFSLPKANVSSEDNKNNQAGADEPKSTLAKLFSRTPKPSNKKKKDESIASETRGGSESVSFAERTGTLAPKATEQPKHPSTYVNKAQTVAALNHAKSELNNELILTGKASSVLRPLIDPVLNGDMALGDGVMLVEARSKVAIPVFAAKRNQTLNEAITTLNHAEVLESDFTGKAVQSINGVNVLVLKGQLAKKLLVAIKACEKHEIMKSKEMSSLAHDDNRGSKKGIVKSPLNLEEPSHAGTKKRSVTPSKHAKNGSQSIKSAIVESNSPIPKTEGFDSRTVALSFIELVCDANADSLGEEIIIEEVDGQTIHSISSRAVGCYASQHHGVSTSNLRMLLANIKQGGAIKFNAQKLIINITELFKDSDCEVVNFIKNKN